MFGKESGGRLILNIFNNKYGLHWKKIDFKSQVQTVFGEVLSVILSLDSTFVAVNISKEHFTVFLSNFNIAHSWQNHPWGADFGV